MLQKLPNLGKRKAKADSLRVKCRGKIVNYNLDVISNRQVIKLCSRLEKNNDKNIRIHNY